MEEIDTQKLKVAYHEIGHLVAYWIYFGNIDEIIKVRIYPTGIEEDPYGGDLTREDDRRKRKEIRLRNGRGKVVRFRFGSHICGRTRYGLHVCGKSGAATFGRPIG